MAETFCSLHGHWLFTTTSSTRLFLRLRCIFAVSIMATAPKRTRADGEDGQPTDELVTRSDLDSILGTLETNINATITTTTSEVKASFVSAIRQYDEANQRRLSHIEADIAAAQKRLDATEKDNKSLWDTVAELQKALAVAETAVPHVNDFTEQNFARKVDATILRISSKAVLEKAAVQSTLAPWLAEADLSEDKFDILGLDTSKKFILQFKGAPGLALNRCTKAHDLLRNRDGSWRSFVVTKPNGGDEPIFISRDKNPAQVKRELDTKRLAQAWRSKVTQFPDFHVNRTDGVISVKWVPVVRVVPQPGSEPSLLQWNSQWIANNVIDREAVSAEFQLQFRPKSEVAWCL